MSLRWRLRQDDAPPERGRHLLSETHDHGKGESTGRGADVVLALTSLLAARPDALVAAIGPEGRLVPMPASVPSGDHRPLMGHSGLDLVVLAEKLLIIDGWRRAKEKPIVAFDVHMQVDPDQTATVHLFDVRPVHGVHIAVVVAADPEAVLASGEASEALPSGPARVRKDAAAIILQVDAATTALLGWDASDLEGHRTVDFIHPDDVGRAIESWVEMRAGAGSVRVQLRHRHAGGHYLWLEVTNENRLDDPEFRRVVSELVDISAQMAEIEALHDRERVLGRLAEALPIGICHLRADREVAYSNALFEALLGPTDSAEALVAYVDEVDRHAVARLGERPARTPRAARGRHAARLRSAAV